MIKTKNKIILTLVSLFIISISSIQAVSNIDDNYLRWWWENIWWVEFKWTNFWLEITNSDINWSIWSPNYWDISMKWTNYSVTNE